MWATTSKSISTFGTAEILTVHEYHTIVYVAKLYVFFPGGGVWVIEFCLPWS